MSRLKSKQPERRIRCAIYCRKSTEEGLEQDFNSLDAQRESCEAYIASQQHEGWSCLPDHYDDGGYTGGNMERPAFQRLMADVDAGRVDTIVVYKIDRLSRSLIDFTKIIESLERNNVALVSITQALDTRSSMGRLTLNILLSFAQFEREIISERTRDKIAAARRKGKWSGGMPLLGYDVDAAPGGSKLVVNDDEAGRVRQIFEMYIDMGGLLPVVTELERRGWRNKEWVTKKGNTRGGRPFDRSTLHRLLTNVVYMGKVRYKDEVHDGEHEPIVPTDLWQRVQTQLQRNSHSGGATARNKYDALLKGLLYCVPCGTAMSHSYTKRGDKRYRYYVCGHAQKHGWDTCESKSVPAGEIEKFVVKQIRAIGQDPGLVAATLDQANNQARETTERLTGEHGAIQRELRGYEREVRGLIGKDDPNAVSRLADLQERIRTAERRLTEVREELATVDRDTIDETDVTTALGEWSQLWEALTPREQVRVVQLLIERVDYDGRDGTVEITFHPTGIKTLATQQLDSHEEVAA